MWSNTAALAAEPLLLKAIGKLLESCFDTEAPPGKQLDEADKQLILDARVCFCHAVFEVKPCEELMLETILQ